jgi:hypothetical protein
MKVSVELGNGTTLFAGERGERWLASASTRTLTAAARLAPEALIGIQRQGGNAFAFLGASGTTYEARAALAPFVRSSAPFDRLASVTSSAKSVVGVRVDGGLVRSSDNGANWTAVGPAQTRFVGVTLEPGGSGLALAVPEALFFTRDHGDTWQPVEASKVGALGVSTGRGAELIVNAALGTFVWRGNALQAASPESVQRASHALPFSPERGPNAEAILHGRAVQREGQYFELHPTGDVAGHWSLARGTFAGELRSRREPLLDGCRDVRVTAFASHLYYACFVGSDVARQSVSFFRSQDGGRTFAREPYTTMANGDAFRFAAGAAGALLVTGVCATHQLGPGCAMQGLHRRLLAPTRKPKSSASPAPRSSRPAVQLLPVATPGLGGVATALAFSTDGLTAYALARRNKAGEYALFVSKDQGNNFLPRALEELPSEVSKQPWSSKATRQSMHREPVPAVLTPGDDGSVSIVFRTNAGSLLVVTDAEGRTTGVSNAPGDESRVGAAGSRALAISVAPRQAWETLDAGASWQPIGRVPVDLCPTGRDCDVALTCSRDGCVVGNVLSRLGWGVQADDDSSLLPPPRTSVAANAERRLRTPLSCSLDAAPWKGLPGAWGAPSADQAALGKSAWFMVTSDETRASAGVLQAFGGERPRIETSTLLAPVPRPQAFALYVSAQVEGGAALRYRTPEASAGESRLRDAEVAWTNVIEARTVRAPLADAGVYRPGDYESGNAGGAQRAKPALLSISTGGVYARIHASDPAQPTLFFDGRGVQRIDTVEWPRAVAERSHSEMVHVGDAHVPVALFGDGAAVVRARANGRGWTYDAQATGLEQPKSFDLIQHHDIAYIGERPGFHVMLYDAAGRVPQNWVFPFAATGTALGAPVAAASQADSVDPPVPCAAELVTNTPRAVVPFQAGTRHPVIVTDAAEPLRLLATSKAVMHGGAKSACVAAFDAEVVKTEIGGEPQAERAILPLGDLEHAWLFRVVTGTDRENGVVQYRAMSCRFDPRAEVPPEAYRVLGALVPAAR